MPDSHVDGPPDGDEDRHADGDRNSHEQPDCDADGHSNTDPDEYVDADSDSEAGRRRLRLSGSMHFGELRQWRLLRRLFVPGGRVLRAGHG